MTEGIRPERAAEEFREVLAEEIPKLKDPRVGFVTVTGVEVTRDLRVAVVTYTVMGDESERKATRAGLRSAASRLRSELGRQVRLRFLPELRFQEDRGRDHAARVEKVLREIRERGDDEPAG